MKTMNLSKTVSRLMAVITTTCLFTFNASASSVFDSKVTCENQDMKIVVAADSQSAEVLHSNGQVATHRAFIRNLTGGSNFQIVILHISGLNDSNEDLIISDRFNLAGGTAGSFNKTVGFGTVTTARFNCQY